MISGLPRFFLTAGTLTGTELRLDKDIGHQICRVLRMRAGDGLVLLDGHGGARQAEILSIGRSEVVVTLGESAQCATEATVPVTLCAAVIKGDRQDWLIQKATELGVARIAPLLTAHSVARAEGEKHERWLRIAKEAAEQSERRLLPRIDPPRTLADVLANREPCALELVCTERQGKPISGLLDPVPRSVTLFVGPEGGWTPDEVLLLTEGGAKPTSLGPRILRAETAAIAAVSVVMAHLHWSGALGRAADG